MVKFSQKTYLNFGECLIMENEFAQLIITLEVGPRIISYKITGGENILFNDVDRVMTFESDKLRAEAGELGEWVMYGGHRFWTSPEDMYLTYDPDNRPCDTELDEKFGSVTLKAPVRAATGLQKTVKVTLSQNSAKVTIDHILDNKSDKTRDIAIWGVTVIDAGGVELIPLPVNETEEILPRQVAALWHGAKMNDSRLQWKPDCAVLMQDTECTDYFKLGTCVEDGWVGCFAKEALFVIRVPFDPDKVYPDRGCNYETFTNTLLTEMETLGEFAPLKPGESRTHTEVWNMIPFEKIPDFDESFTVETIGHLAHELLD